jgi:hypothetical protein
MWCDTHFLPLRRCSSPASTRAAAASTVAFAPSSVHSVPELIAKIEAYLDATNNNPKPFVWTATTESILAKIARGRVALERSVNSETDD